MCTGAWQAAFSSYKREKCWYLLPGDKRRKWWNLGLSNCRSWWTRLASNVQSRISTARIPFRLQFVYLMPGCRSIRWLLKVISSNPLKSCAMGLASDSTIWVRSWKLPFWPTTLHSGSWSRVPTYFLVSLMPFESGITAAIQDHAGACEARQPYDNNQ